MTGDSHRPPRSRCAINAATKVLGDPWSMLVLRDVIFGRSSAIAGASVTPLARLLDDSGRTGVRPDSVQVSGGTLSSRLPTAYLVWLAFGLRTAGHRDGAWLQRGLPSS